MKKIKKCMIAIVVFATVIINSTGCESKPIMDEDKCAEVALEYMKNKYHEDFEVTYSQEKKRIIGRAGYAEVDVRVKGKEKEYRIMMCPDGYDDSDKDGYYDSYIVISDDYMCDIVNNKIKVELDSNVKNVIVNKFISDIYITERNISKIEGFWGFSSDFSFNEKNNTLDGLLKNENVYITYRIEIPENEFSMDYEKNITEILKPKISEDIISISIVSYPEETYLEREKIYKEKGYEEIGGLIGTDEIDFFIEEETNESK